MDHWLLALQVPGMALTFFLGSPTLAGFELALSKIAPSTELEDASLLRPEVESASHSKAYLRRSSSSKQLIHCLSPKRQLPYFLLAVFRPVCGRCISFRPS